MRTSTYNQKYLNGILNKDMICVDMTMGNGNDTLFLVKRVKFVYAFDIQVEAITNTRKKLQNYDNYRLILDSHDNIDQYVNEGIDVVMFNLGYLPGSESNLVSKSETTIKAIEKAYQLLKKGGYISIIAYRGHKGGLSEYHAIEKLIKDNDYQVIERYISYTSNTEPILIMIRK